MIIDQIIDSMTTEQLLRIQCLEFAIQSSGGSYVDIVRAAKAFEDHINGKLHE